MPAIAVGFLVWFRDIELQNPSGLFTATSIVTGLTFNMTTTFWSKSIEARRDPKRAMNVDILDVVDGNRDHLVWTVAVGIAATCALALVAIFASPSGGAPVCASVVCSALVIYLLTLVARALVKFRQAALQLR